MGCCFSSSKSVDLPPVPPAPGKQRSTLPEFPTAASPNNNDGISTFAGGATNRALEED